MIKRLEKAFLAVIIFFSLYLLNNFYEDYSFKNNPIPKTMQEEIVKKEQEILHKMKINYGYSYKFPLIVTDKIPGKLYGLTSMDKRGNINIYLNKKVMRESFDYMLDTVIAHEYAHALLFKLNRDTKKDDGHSALWQEACTKLGGIKCQKYVNSQDVVMGKLPF